MEHRYQRKKKYFKNEMNFCDKIEQLIIDKNIDGKEI